MDLNEVPLGQRIMALLVAEHGLGKSGLAASFYKEGPVHFFDFDGRMDGVKRLFPHVPKGSISYETYGPMKEGKIKSIIQFEKDLESLVKSCPYKTIVLDGLASMTNTSIVFQMVTRGAASVAQLPESFAEKDKNKQQPKETKGGIPVPGWDEFNGEAMFMCEVFDICKVLPCNVILTSWPVARTKINDTDKTKESLVTFGVKTPGMVPGYFNEIWRVISEAQGMEANSDVKRFIVTQPYGDYIAKTSLPLPGKIEIPKIDKWGCACCREDGYFYGNFSKLKKEGLERLNKMPEVKIA